MLSTAFKCEASRFEAARGSVLSFRVDAQSFFSVGELAMQTNRIVTG